MSNRVYHWKHGWIPLDHAAAMSKAKGNHASAAKMLESVKHEHLPRDKHITVAHTNGRVAIRDSKSGHATGIDAHVAASLNDRGHHITGVNHDGTLNTRTPGGATHTLDASGTAIHARKVQVGQDVSIKGESNSKVRIAEISADGQRARVQNSFQSGAKGTWIHISKLVPYGSSTGRESAMGGRMKPGSGVVGLPATRRHSG